MMNIDNTGWTMREIRYACEKDKPNLSDKELDSWAEEVYRELNAINRQHFYNDQKFQLKNTPFSDYYANDVDSNYSTGDVVS